MTIWYDLSGIYNWEGNFTGIQRVVYNLGEKLANTDPRTKFFIFQHGSFQEIGFQEIRQRFEKPAAATRNIRRFNAGRLRHRAIDGMKSLVRDTWLEPKLRVVYNFLRKRYRRTKKAKGDFRVSRLFKSDDLVIIVDGNWQFPDFAESIKASKAKNNFKLIHFVHDLAALRNPNLANPGANEIIGAYFKEIFKISDKLVTISKSTLNDIEWYADMESLRIPPIEVLILGDDSLEAARPKMQKPNIALEGQFILAVGTIEVRKNYLALFYLYKLARQKRIRLPQLIISGRRGWMADEAYALLSRDSDLKGQVAFLQANDGELEWLYQNCEFTLFPSFYEGWGLPVAEALVHGKCCISSNESSMPEVGGDFPLYASPYDPAEWLDACQKLLDLGYRHRREQEIRRHYKTHSWTQTLKELTNIIEKTKSETL